MKENGCLLRFVNVVHVNKKKLSKLEKKHDVACKKKFDKFALLMWDTAGTCRRAFFFFGQFFFFFWLKGNIIQLSQNG